VTLYDNTAPTVHMALNSVVLHPLTRVIIYYAEFQDGVLTILLILMCIEVIFQQNMIIVLVVN
jgi:hypothetical protein